MIPIKLSHSAVQPDKQKLGSAITFRVYKDENKLSSDLLVLPLVVAQTLTYSAKIARFSF